MGDSAQGDGILLSQEFLRRKLRAAENPFQVIEEIQAAHAPKLKSCDPALGFLEVLGFKRLELYRDLCSHLKTELFKSLRVASRESLTALLLKTLPFLSFGPPLGDVPISVLGSLSSIPDNVLELLSTMDQKTFEKLPNHIRQQVWERFPETFQTVMDGLIERYLSDPSALTWADEMHPDAKYPAPHKRRTRNGSLQLIVRAIKPSAKLYRYFVDEVRERFVQTRNTRYCALRADILMALHDVSPALLETEPCHTFAWHLDAFVKQVVQAVGQGNLDMKTAQNQKSVVSELVKVMSNQFTASPAFPVPNSAKGRLGGLGQFNLDMKNKAKSRSAGALTSRLGPKKPVDLNSVLLEVALKLRKEDRNKWFHNPVVEAFPQLEQSYLAVIKNPMDLSTIEGKIRQREYKSIDEMRADLHLIADNARLFNGEKAKIATNAYQLMKIRSESLLNKASTKLEDALREAKLLEEEKALKAKSGPPSGTGNDDAADATASPKSNGGLTPENSQASASQPPVIDPKEEERLRKEEALEETKRLAQLEANSRLSHAISDAAMILASGYTVNALTNVLWFSIDQDVVKHERLPRDGALTHNISWLLQTAGLAHDLVCVAQGGDQVGLPELSFQFERQVVPAFAFMLLDSTGFRVSKSSSDSDDDVDPLVPGLEKWCKRDKMVQNAVLHFLCDRVNHRDRAMVQPLLELVKNLKSAATDHSAFMHSLVTSIYMSSHEYSRDDLSKKGGYSLLAKRPPVEVAGSGGRPNLSSEIIVDIVTGIYLPAVLRTSALTTSPVKTAQQHGHFTRLLNLGFTQSCLGKSEISNYVRAAILSLSGYKGDDPFQILTSQELKDNINRRYGDPSFERAHRQYEKLFRIYPSLRAQCGLSPVAGGRSGALPLPSPSPSPFITPSPSPSPQLPSPFHSSVGGATSSPTRKRLLDPSLPPIPEGEEKRAKTEEDSPGEATT